VRARARLLLPVVAIGVREGIPFWAGGASLLATAAVCAAAIPARWPGAAAALI